MLRVAVPNKGALSEAAVEMLAEAGYRQRRDRRELVIFDAQNQVEFFYLRPRDIAVYVSAGTLDIGITGRDLLLDAQGKTDQTEAASSTAVTELLELGFAAASFRFAGPVGTFQSPQDLKGKRIATSYDGLLRRYLAAERLDATVVRLDGAVESAIRLGVADAIADVVDTGTTLRAAGLEIFGEPILDSEAVLITRATAQLEGLEVLIRRLRGVIVARQYVLMDYDIPEAQVEEAARLTPGFESPTVSPLKRPGWVAVRSMVSKQETHQVMDQLYELGARAILVSSIHACRI